MIEPLEQAREWDDVEALVRAAGGYVRPSEELRPRVLEAAGVEASERRALQRIWHVALAIAILGVLTVIGARWHAASPFAPSVLQAQAEVQQAGGNSAGWTLVESFTDLRRRQAALLRLTR